VADFIADHSIVEVMPSFTDNKLWKLYFNGSNHKNGTGIGIMILSPQNVLIKFKFRLNQFCSNNEAEYEALITGLEILLETEAKCVEIKGDSELVLKQLIEEYRCAKENLIMYYVGANALLKRFSHVEIQHIPRLENQEANDVAQKASGYKASKEDVQETIEVRNKRSSKDAFPQKWLIPKLGGTGAPGEHAQGKNMVKNFVTNNLTDDGWRKPIVNYLENPDGITCRKIKYRALSYIIMGNNLFKKTPEGVLLKCLGETDAYVMSQ